MHQVTYNICLDVENSNDPGLTLSQKLEEEEHCKEPTKDKSPTSSEQEVVKSFMKAFSTLLSFVW